MRIAMLADNDAVFDSRIRRQAAALAESGREVSVFCIRSGDAPAQETADRVTYVRRPMPRLKEIFLGRKSPGVMPEGARDVRAKTATSASTTAAEDAAKSPLRRFIGDLVVFKAIEHAFADDVSNFRPQVIHAHDLATLPAGARFATRLDARLVYDAHELEWDRNANYSRAVVAFRRYCEQKFIRRADRVITVSPSIAKFLSSKHQIAIPELVLNAPEAATSPPGGQTIRQACGLSPDAPLGVYVGALMPNRGLEQIITAAESLEGVVIALLGPGNSAFAARLRRLATDAGVDDRIMVLDPRPSETVVSFISDADFSLIPIQDVCLSYRYAFPNKLLESAFAGLPVVAANLPDISAFVRAFECGVVVDQSSPAAIADGARRVLSDPNAFRISPDNRKKLNSDYSWEEQKRKLCRLYDALDT
jgi:glycosyltransferase involved in cell wall biosynthesis